MREAVRELRLKNRRVKAELLFVDETDREELRSLFRSWKTLNSGMKQFRSRGVNLPEGISESAFCLDFNKNCARVLKVTPGPASFDVIDLKSKKMLQIKAVSVEEDLTSFGPTSVWDELYFLDFYRDGKLDGSFDVYLIPDDLVYSHIVNVGKNETFRDQQEQGRRPRLSVKKGIIAKHGIEPIKSCTI